MILARMGAVEQIVVLGDYAKGIDSGLIEVLVVGKELNQEYIDQLAVKIEQEISRKVQFTTQQNYFSPQDQVKSLIIYEEIQNNKINTSVL